MSLSFITDIPSVSAASTTDSNLGGTLAVSAEEFEAREGDIDTSFTFSEAVVLADPASTMVAGFDPGASNTVTSGDATGFGFTVTIVDADGNPISITPGDPGFNAEAATIAAITEAALENWGTFINGAPGATIDVELTIDSLEEGAIASAGPGGFFFTDDGLDNFVDANGNGVLDDGETVIIEAVSAAELQSGVDLNGDDADINVTVNSDVLSAGDFHIDEVTFDPVTGEASVTLADEVPAGLIDLFSVLLHELGHGFGFLGFRDTPTDDLFPFTTADGTEVVLGTLFDVFTNVSDPSRVVFDGPATVAAYGEAVALEIATGDPGSDLGHFVGSEAGFDTRLSLLNPFVTPGDRVNIGALELAVLQDLGYDISIPTDLALINELDSVADSRLPVYTLSSSEITTSGITLEIDGSNTPVFTSIASSVAVEVTSSAISQSQRVLFNNGGVSQTVTISFADLAAGSDLGFVGTQQLEFDVRFFNPAQAALANGTNSQDVATIVSDILFTGGLETSDDIRAGNGADVVFGRGGNDNLVGGGGDDLLIGGLGDDRLVGDSGNDVIEGGAGIDRILGGEGNDSLIGGDGNDTIFGDVGNDIIDGGEGIDRILGGDGDDVINGDSGDDRVVGEDGNDVLNGGSGSDRILGGSGQDTLDGGSDDDNIDGGEDDDILSGSSGNDRVVGADGNDTLNGGSGNDRIRGDDGDDIIEGGTGNDNIVGGIGDDEISGQSGIDRILGDSGADTISGGTGNDRINGNTGDDIINGDADNDNLLGGAGNDIIDGGSGIDRLVGNSGDDILNGGSGDDRLTGSSGEDTLNGDSGEDTLNGGSNSDTLNGGTGDDRLAGGTGDDTFVFEANFGEDRISDFEDGELLDVSALGVTGLSGLDIVADGNNTLISVAGDADNVITLVNVDPATLDASNFTFSSASSILDDEISRFDFSNVAQNTTLADHSTDLLLIELAAFQAIEDIASGPESSLTQVDLGLDVFSFIDEDGLLTLRDFGSDYDLA